MSKILFTGGLTLIILWAFAVFKYHIFGFVHLLPVIALIALTVRLFYNKLDE